MNNLNNSLSIDSLNNMYRTYMDSVLQHSNEVAANTSPNVWFDSINLLSSIVTIVGALVIFKVIAQYRISINCQKAILDDIVRHLYRNLVIIISMKIKHLEAYKNTTNYLAYPSEEHYLKLAVLPEDLHLDRFNNNPSIYKLLHQLHLLMRNYNIEVDTALNHIKDRTIPLETKQKDFDLLILKSGILTEVIIEIQKGKYAKYFSYKTRKVIKRCWKTLCAEAHKSVHHTKEIDKTMNSQELAYYNEISSEVSLLKQGCYLKSIVQEHNHSQFIDDLIRNISLECSSNKIHIIKIKNN